MEEPKAGGDHPLEHNHVGKFVDSLSDCQTQAVSHTVNVQHQGRSSRRRVATPVFFSTVTEAPSDAKYIIFSKSSLNLHRSVLV